MKNFLAFTKIICLISVTGSLIYYFSFFLPRQQQDLNAIRSAIASTSQQAEVQRQQALQQEAQTEKAINNYLTCTIEMQKKESAWLDVQCKSNPNDPTDMLKQMDCRSKAMTSLSAKQFDCPRPL